MDAIEQILDFGLKLRFSDLPQHVINRAKIAFLDTMGATLAGIQAEGVPELSSLVSAWGGRPESTLVTNGEKVPAPWAALVNGVCGRACDLDDVHEQGTCHINVTSVPALLAIAEAKGRVDGRQFLTAAVVAAEITCRMALAPRISYSATGMSKSYQCGIFGSTLGICRILGLDREEAQNAMGIAYAFVAGNQQGYVDGAHTVRLMQGRAAETAVMAARMAEKGLTGSKQVLEGKFGYYPVFHRGKYEPEELVDKLGSVWRLLEISIKPVYPCCKYTHGPIEATIAAMGKAGCSVDDIKKLEVTVTNKEVYDLVCLSRERKWNPTSITDAQFSIPYTVATAAVYKQIAFDRFKQDALQDQAVAKVMKRVEAILDVEGQGDGVGTFPMPGLVKVRTKSGEAFDARVDYVKGHPFNPMSFEDVAEKFRLCAEYGVPDWLKTDDFVEAVQNIEEVDDVSCLIDLVNVFAKPKK